LKSFIFFILLLAVIIEVIYSPQLGVARGINIKNIGIYAVAIVVMATEVATKNINKKRIPGLRMLSFLFIYLCISIGINVMLNRSDITLFEQVKLLKNRFVEPVILYVLTILLIDDIKSAKSFLKIVVLVFTAINILSLVEITTHIPIFFTEEKLSQSMHPGVYAGRFVSGFGNPNQMAYLLCSLLPFMYFYYKYDQNKLVRMIFMTSIFFSCASILMAGSRGGLLTLLVVIVSVALVFKDYKPAMVILSFSFIFVALSLLFNNELLQSAFNRVALSFGEKADISSGRISIWSTLFAVFSDSFTHIFFGTGFETISGILYKKTHTYLPAHDLHLQVLVELGLLGLTLWLLMLRSVCRFLQGFNRSLFRSLTLIFFSVLLMGSMFSELIMITKYIAMVAGVAFSYLYHSIKLDDQGTASLSGWLKSSL